jgi:ADP-heptose:LPS heptosyltransferase
MRRDPHGHVPVVTRSTDRHGFLLLPLCGLGDAVLFLPALRALRARYPAEAILVIVASRQAKAVIEAARLRVEVIVFNRAIDGGVFSVLRLVRLVRRRRCRVVISGAHYHSVRVPLLALCTGATLRIGTSSERLRWAYNSRVEVQQDVHSATRYLQLLKGLGVTAPHSPRVELTPSKGSEASARQLWHRLDLTDATVVGIASGADVNQRSGWQPRLKKWTVAGYARVTQWLVSTARVRVVAFGTADEAEWAVRVSALANVPVASLCGKTSVDEMMWLLRCCAVVICNDTGTMHLSAAVGTPVVALFGPTDPAVFGPRTAQGESYGLQEQVIQGKAPCAPCYPHPTCQLARCVAMESISSEDVIRRVSIRLCANHGASVTSGRGGRVHAHD